MTYLRYTTKSLVHPEEALGKLGHCIKRSALAEVLHRLGYSLKPNKKTLEGESHPDRDRQFQHINKKCQEFEKQGHRILSIDCKKKEPLGNFKKNGREWAKKGKGSETQVNVYDFPSLAQGHANPYGISDVLKKQGFGSAGHRS